MNLNCLIEFVEIDGKRTPRCTRCGRRYAPTASETFHAPCREANGDCIHKGRSAGEVQCKTCAGKVMVKLFQCDQFGTCTIGKTVAGHGCCQTCERYTKA